MTPVLDVVVPVHNEEHTVAACVRRLHAHLVHTFPYPFRITIADNASTDATVAVAEGLVGEYADLTRQVRLLEVAEKGRGRALKAAWLASDAPILAYMDVDLSTDLDALWPLVAPLMSGHSDLAIGTRLHRDSRVVRSAKREFISRSYNAILRAAMGASFSDAQCGFKAIRADVARELLPLVEDDSWFFDTELLVLAQRSGLRIHEVPVDWYDDPDSRVAIVSTARDDLAGVRRLQHTLAHLPLGDIRDRMGRTSPTSGVGAQTVRFGLVGALTTLLHLGLFAALLGQLDSQPANLVALACATVVNTGLNRRWTFGVRGRSHRWRHQAQGFSVFLLTWALTAASLAALAHVWSGAPDAVQTLVVGLATVIGTVVKFVAMRSWMFAPSRRITPPPSRREVTPEPRRVGAK